MTSARILVTGSSGLVGAALVRALRERGVETHGVSRRAATDYLTHRTDLASAEDAADLLARVQPSVIVHLAGGREENVQRLYESNALTTVNLLQAAARLDRLPSFITAGSAAEYGEPPSGIASESDPAHPISNYGRAKLASSMMAMSLAADSGLRLSVVRPFNIVAPGLSAAVALGNFRQQLAVQPGKRRVVRCGRLDVVRDFVPLEFVVQVLSTLVELEELPLILNVCSGVGIGLADVLREMAACVGAEVSVITDPGLAAISAAARVVGDASLLNELGLCCRPTASSLANLLMGGVG